MANSAMPAGTPAISPSEALNQRFTTIYAAHQASITSLVRREVRGNDPHLAEDLTAQAFYRAWLDLHKLRATSDAGTYAWLAQIARRTVTAHYRAKRNTCETPADLGHWTYSNRAMETAGGWYTPAATGFRTAGNDDIIWRNDDLIWPGTRTAAAQ